MKVSGEKKEIGAAPPREDLTLWVPTAAVLACPRSQTPHLSGCFNHSQTMASKFPKVQGGGSLIVAWQVKQKNVLVVGGGEVSFTPYRNI